jgi:hypothetical protein
VITAAPLTGSIRPVNNCSAYNGGGETVKGNILTYESEYVNNTDVSLYDHELESILPFMMTAWPSNSTSAASPWADVRLVCTKPQRFSNYSRMPSENSASGFGIVRQGLLSISIIFQVLNFMIM